MMPIFIVYLIVVNIIAFVMYGMDKKKAIKREYRIPEKTLIGIAVIGGSVGAYMGMQTFRHKTLHIKFTVGVPLIFFVQLGVAYGVINYVIPLIK